MKKYTPPIPIETYIDDYVDEVFRLAPWVGAGNSCPMDVKNKGYSIIPETAKMHPYTNRVVAAGVVYHALSLCDSCISQKDLSKVSERSTRLLYISTHAISGAARYVRDKNNLDRTW